MKTLKVELCCLQKYSKSPRNISTEPLRLEYFIQTIIKHNAWQMRDLQKFSAISD